MRHRPFHSYTMKQAIQEGFILDVLKHYTPVNSYYRLVKTVEGDPQFDTKRARKKLRRYVESYEHAIRLKVEIMVDHFHEQVLALNKIGGQARAMVVTRSIERAIQYFRGRVSVATAFLGRILAAWPHDLSTTWIRPGDLVRSVRRRACGTRISESVLEQNRR